MRIHNLAGIFIAVVALAGVAEARPVRFVGPHPVNAKLGGGFCYIETPHLHVYAPDHSPLYQQVNDQYVFTGDPTPFGYEGDKYKYYGHHPIGSNNGEPVFCFIDGPHFHAVEPPDEGYKTKSGVAFYVGPYTPAYQKIRPQRVKVVNAEYRPYAQYRPVVEVQPPAEWQGEVYVPPPPSVQVSAPGVIVNAPAPPVMVAPPPPRVVVEAPPPPHVVVEAPAPRVDVRVRGPGVVVAPPAPHIVVAPPAPHVVVAPPAPHVIVAPPRPHGVIVAPAPGVVVAPAPGVIVVKGKHGHHDNGKHKGWYK